MTNGSEYMWYECGKAFYLRESELELEYHVFAHCSILCYAFQGMLTKLSAGMCTGMVVCLKIGPSTCHIWHSINQISFLSSSLSFFLGLHFVFVTKMKIKTFVWLWFEAIGQESWFPIKTL